MLFDIHRKDYYSFNGRVLLRSSFMLPSGDESFPQNYITRFVNACESFSDNCLYPTLLQVHAVTYNSQQISSVYSYNVTITEIYNSAPLLSYVIFAVMKRNAEFVATGAKALSFYGNKIIPTRFINKNPKYKRKQLLFDEKGYPAYLTLTDGHFQINQIQ